MIKNLLDCIFSIDNQNGEDARKVITLLGVKVKLKNLKSDLFRRTVILNRNTLQILYNQLPLLADDDLFCLRAKDIIFIFNKGVLNLDYRFFQDYVVLYGFSTDILELIKLEKTSVLYKEHIDRLKNGEFCWKYVDRNYYIGHAFISQQDGDIYIHSSYVKEKNLTVDDSNIHHVPMESKRKYIKGIAVGDYLKNRPLEFQIEVMQKLLHHVFVNYRDKENPGRVSGKLLDCHLYNFILGEDGKFYFVDFDLECRESLERGYCVFFMLYYYDRKLYNAMLKKFGYKDKHHYYQEHFIKTKTIKNHAKISVSEEHKELRQKYFTDAGILAHYKVSEEY